MNRRHFFKIVPTLAAAMPAVMSAKPTPSRNPKIPRSIMLVWVHKMNPSKNGSFIWNTPNEEAYLKSIQEACIMHLRLVLGGYNVHEQEFNAITFRKP